MGGELGFEKRLRLVSRKSGTCILKNTNGLELGFYVSAYVEGMRLVVTFRELQYFMDLCREYNLNAVGVW